MIYNTSLRTVVLALKFHLLLSELPVLSMQCLSKSLTNQVYLILHERSKSAERFLTL